MLGGYLCVSEKRPEITLQGISKERRRKLKPKKQREQRIVDKEEHVARKVCKTGMRIHGQIHDALALKRYFCFFLLIWIPKVLTLLTKKMVSLISCMAFQSSLLGI